MIYFGSLADYPHLAVFDTHPPHFRIPALLPGCPLRVPWAPPSVACHVGKSSWEDFLCSVHSPRPSFLENSCSQINILSKVVTWISHDCEVGDNFLWEDGSHKDSKRMFSSFFMVLVCACNLCSYIYLWSSYMYILLLVFLLFLTPFPSLPLPSPALVPPSPFTYLLTLFVLTYVTAYNIYIFSGYEVLIHCISLFLSFCLLHLLTSPLVP